jgi:hypothetical protein
MINENMPLKDHDTFILADESKFSLNAGDTEDSIFYFGVAIKNEQVRSVREELKILLKSINFQGVTLHATKAFSEKRPRKDLMQAITDLFLKHQLHCFYYKYDKAILYEVSKILNSFNNDIIKFTNPEFQAVFYFLIFLNTNLRDNKSLSLGQTFFMLFDSNVYGRTETEDFHFPDDRFVIKKMSFVKKTKISELALPDFIGYLFRKTYLQHNSPKSPEFISELSTNAYDNLKRLAEAKLLHYLNIKDEAEVLNQMFQLNKEH